MHYRQLGRTGWNVSAVSFGSWAIGGGWGAVDDEESLAALHRAVDLGVNFFDTADVYGDGKSERLLARSPAAPRADLHRHQGRPPAQPARRRRLHRREPDRLRRSCLRNLETEALDLVQLHCPPWEVYYMPEVFGALDDLVQQGKVRHYGVSVEKVEEALKAMEYPGVETVQIIFNIFRQRPAELFFAEARRRQVGIIVRVPLASGLLTGKMTRADEPSPPTTIAPTIATASASIAARPFSGVDFELGLQAVEELRALLPPGSAWPSSPCAGY